MYFRGLKHPTDNKVGTGRQRMNRTTKTEYEPDDKKVSTWRQNEIKSNDKRGWTERQKSTTQTTIKSISLTRKRDKCRTRKVEKGTNWMTKEVEPVDRKGWVVLQKRTNWTTKRYKPDMVFYSFSTPVLHNVLLFRCLLRMVVCWNSKAKSIPFACKHVLGREWVHPTRKYMCISV